MTEREIFVAALEFEDSAARHAHLKALCGGDANMLARLESLLASHDSQSQFLNTPVGEQIADVAWSPDGTIQFGSDSGVEHAEGRDEKKTHAMPLDTDDGPDELPLSYLQPSSRPGFLGRLAHYEISEVLGRGAFGTVLKAFDERLQRVVAIKVLAPEIAATSPPRKRFLREARTSAAVRHENVVSVYAVEDDPIPYLVMEYIPGQTLQQRLDEHGPLDLADVLRLGKQIAFGLAAAHSEKLIHRDVKPGNILLETNVADHVKITDFGLARTADDASVTRSGVIVGTPMYMAPEQALGKRLDHRADLFSLGSVLYQMITGRPPFRASGTIAVLRRVTDDTPRPIREIIPEIPEWMCAIVAKLHAKNPEDRFGSAKEVGELLERCLTGLQQGRVPEIEPQRDSTRDANIPPSDPLGAAKRRSRRRVGYVAAAMLILLAVFGVLEATRVTNVLSSSLWPSPETISPLAEKKELDPKVVKERPKRKDSAAIPAVSYLKTVLRGHRDKITPVVFSPDGRLLASSGIGSVRVWDAHSGELRWELPDPIDKWYMALVFSPDSKFLLTATEQGKAPIGIYEADTGKPAGVLEGHDMGLFELSFSPDGKTLISAGWERLVRVWDFAERRKIRDIPSPSNHWIRSAVFSSTGKIAFGQDKVYLVEPDGTLVRTIEKYAAPLCFSPDGKKVAGTTWGEGMVTIWDVDTGNELASWKAHNGLANGVAFSRQGNAIVTAGGDRKVRLWDVKTQHQLAEFSHDGEAGGVAFSPDGDTLATTGYDLLVKLWDVSTFVKPREETKPDLFAWPKDAPPPALAPFKAEQGKEHQVAWAKYLGVPVEKEIDLGDGQEMSMVLIPPGEFMMGSEEDERAHFLELAKATGDGWGIERIPSEGPRRLVRNTRPFWLGRNEVTLGQFRQFAVQTDYKSDAERDGIGGWGVVERRWVEDPKFVWNGDHGFTPTDQHPVVFVSFNDAASFCRWLSKERAGVECTLPTEAQWEYACRAGTTSYWQCGSNVADLRKVGWFNENANGELQAVGKLRPNGFGLFDMQGNVWEWCADFYGADYYQHAPTNDPTGLPTGTSRSQRGGDWFYHANYCRSAYRHFSAPRNRSVSLGFRVAAMIAAPK